MEKTLVPHFLFSTVEEKLEIGEKVEKVEKTFVPHFPFSPLGKKNEKLEKGEKGEQTLVPHFQFSLVGEKNERIENLKKNGKDNCPPVPIFSGCGKSLKKMKMGKIVKRHLSPISLFPGGWKI